MHNKYLKVFIISLLLNGLLGVMACATGNPGIPPDKDPEFWKMWADKRGLG